MPEIIALQEAQVRGLKRFFTGDPCKRGHVSERLVSNRECCECSREKRRKNPDKFREARLKSTAKLRAADPDKSRAKQRAYRAENSEKVRGYSRKNRKKRRETKIEAQRRADILALVFRVRVKAEAEQRRADEEEAAFFADLEAMADA
jgi:hypothetical protein